MSVIKSDVVSSSGISVPRARKTCFGASEEATGQYALVENVSIPGSPDTGEQIGSTVISCDGKVAAYAQTENFTGMAPKVVVYGKDLSDNWYVSQTISFDPSLYAFLGWIEAGFQGDEKHLALSGDGQTMALCVAYDYNSPGNKTLQILLYKKVAGIFVLQETILPEDNVSNYYPNLKVSLSYDGAVLAYVMGINTVEISYGGIYRNGILEKLIEFTMDPGEGTNVLSVSVSGDGETIAFCTVYPGSSEDQYSAVYIYKKVEEQWEETHVFLNPFPQNSTEFGVSVSLNGLGDTIAIGVNRYMPAQSFGSAAVFISTYSGSSWGEYSVISSPYKSEATSANRNFGNSVSLSFRGDTLVSSSATIRSDVGILGQIFIRSGEGSWLYAGTINNYAYPAQFVNSVAVAGNLSAVVCGSYISTGFPTFIRSSNFCIFDLQSADSNNPVVFVSGVSAVTETTPQGSFSAPVTSPVIPFNPEGEGAVSESVENTTIQLAGGGTSTFGQATAGITWAGVAMSNDGDTIVAAARNEYIYLSRDFGGSWEQVASAGQSSWTSICCSVDATVILACDEDYAKISKDGGVTWDVVVPDVGNPANGPQVCACSTNGQVLYIGKNSGELYKSTDGGDNWFYLGDPYAWETLSCSASGDELVATADYGALLVSLDGAASWTENLASKNWVSAAISYDGEAIFGAEDTTNKIWYSTNSGSTWESKTVEKTWVSVTCAGNAEAILATPASGYPSRQYLDDVWKNLEEAGSRNWIAGKGTASSGTGGKHVALAADGQIITILGSLTSDWTTRYLDIQEGTSGGEAAGYDGNLLISTTVATPMSMTVKFLGNSYCGGPRSISNIDRFRFRAMKKIGFAEKSSTLSISVSGYGPNFRGWDVVQFYNRVRVFFFQDYPIVLSGGSTWYFPILPSTSIYSAQEEYNTFVFPQPESGDPIRVCKSWPIKEDPSYFPTANRFPVNVPAGGGYVYLSFNFDGLSSESEIKVTLTLDQDE